MVHGDDPHCKRRVFDDSPSNSFHLMGYEGSSLMDEGVQSNCGACFAEKEGEECEAYCRSGYVGESASFTCSGGSFKGSISCIPTYVYIEEGAYCSKHTKPLAATNYSSECAVSIQQDPECGPAFTFYPRTKCECTRLDGDDPHCDHRRLTVKSTSAYHLVGHNGTSLLDEGVMTDCGSCIPEFQGTRCTASCRPGYWQDQGGRYVGGSVNFVCAGTKFPETKFEGQIRCNPAFELVQERASCTTPTKALPGVNYASQCASQVMKDDECGRAYVFRERTYCECATVDGGDPLCKQRHKHTDADIAEADIMSTYKLLEDIPSAALADMQVSFTLVPAPPPPPTPTTTSAPPSTSLSTNDRAMSSTTAQNAQNGGDFMNGTTSSQPQSSTGGAAGPDPGSEDLLDLISDDLKATTTRPSNVTTTRRFASARANKPAIVPENQKAVASRGHDRNAKGAVILILLCRIQSWTE